MANHPVAAAVLTDEQRAALTVWSKSRVLPQRQVLRARIILLAAEGVPTNSIATRLGCSVPTARLWRQRFAEAGLAGLEEDAPGRGRPAVYDERTVAKVISVTLGAPPRGETHWSSSAVAERVGVSATTVLRIWREQVNSHVASDAGFAYQAYVRLKLASVRAFGAELILQLRGIPALSPLSRVVAELIDAWLRLTPYKKLVPASIQGPERQKNISDVEAILGLLKNVYGVAYPDRDA